MLRWIVPAVAGLLACPAAQAQNPPCTDFKEPCVAQAVAWKLLSSDTLPHGVMELFYDPASIAIQDGLHRVTFKDVVRYTGMAGSTRQHRSGGDIYYRYVDCVGRRMSMSVTPQTNAATLRQHVAFWVEDSADTRAFFEVMRGVMAEACRVRNG